MPFVKKKKNGRINSFQGGGGVVFVLTKLVVTFKVIVEAIMNSIVVSFVGILC